MSTTPLDQLIRLGLRDLHTLPAKQRCDLLRKASELLSPAEESLADTCRLQAAHIEQSEDLQLRLDQLLARS